MQSTKVIPIVLAGGRGTRLWPTSREDLPKQFCKIDGERSLFQKCLKLVREGELFAAPVVVTGRRYAALAEEQMRAIGVEAHMIIQEPCGRDTTAAIALAVESVRTGSDEIMIALPSDHMFGDEIAFLQAVRTARYTIEDRAAIVTFGIKPTHPETGYGYLRVGEVANRHGSFGLSEFLEKPSQETASKLIEDPSVYWNAGIFLFKQSVVREEISRYARRVMEQVAFSIQMGERRGNMLLPSEPHFERVASISFDYSVMERTKRAAVVPMDPKWSDVGSWKAVWDMQDKDENFNVLDGMIYATDTTNSLIKSDGPAVGVAGLNDVIVVVEKDAVLVTSKDKCQGVKTVVEEMKADQLQIATNHSGEDRPWGRFDSLDRGDGHQVKRIRVDAGGQLSLQYHHHRAEHWVVIAGTATVTVDDKVSELKAGEQVYVPKGAVHRLENFTQEPVDIIEVQIGNYFGEDDIVRVEDVYGRDPEPNCAAHLQNAA